MTRMGTMRSGMVYVDVGIGIVMDVVSRDDDVSMVMQGDY